MVDDKKDITNKGTIVLGIGTPDLRSTIKSVFLELDTVDIIGASNGNKVLRLLREYGPKNNIFVIMDWDLPQISGIDISREIRGDKNMENYPILLLTSDINPELIGLAGEVGVNGLVVKPFVLENLLNKIVGIINTRKDPPEHVKLIKRGEMMIVRGHYNKALDFFKESQQLNNSARILVHMGEALEMMEKYTKAHDSYDEAVDVNPQYLKAYVTASNLLLRLNEEESALPYLEQAVVISPYNPDRQTLLGTVYLKQGDDESAEKAFREAVRQDHGKHREIGEHYLSAGNTRMAEQYFRSYIDTGSGPLLPEIQIHVYNRLGITLRRQGAWEKAVCEYNKALEINERDPVIYFNMGKAFIEGGKIHEARTWFKKALEIEPDFPEAVDELKKIGID
ncbi:MAG: tetratricopeptide repeat protein [Nitrospinota bacterium]